MDCPISLSPEHASILDYDVFVNRAVSIDDFLSLAKGYDVWVVDVDVAFGGDSQGHPTVAELLSEIGDLIDKISGFFRVLSLAKSYDVWVVDVNVAFGGVTIDSRRSSDLGLSHLTPQVRSCQIAPIH